MGLGVPVAFVKEIKTTDCTDDCYTKEDAKEGIGKFMFYLAIANSFFGALFFLTYRLRPS